MPAPRRAAGSGAAPEPPKKRKAGQQSHTNKALTARAIEIVASREDVRDAVAWCASTGQGAKAAMRTGNFPHATLGKVRQALLQGSTACDRDHHLQILTNLERIRVAEWALACADNHKPQGNAAISEKIREVLRARHAANKKRKYGKGCVRLNKCETQAVNSQGVLSHTFFSHFYAWCRAKEVGIELGVDRAQDVRRARKMKESTVQNHFYGEFGLEAELVHAGIMDPTTKVCPSSARHSPSPLVASHNLAPYTPSRR